MIKVLLYPHSLSSAQVIPLPPRVTEVRPSTATVFSQVASGSVQGKAEAVDLSALAEQEQMEVRALLQKYNPICYLNLL